MKPAVMVRGKNQRWRLHRRTDRRKKIVHSVKVPGGMYTFAVCLSTIQCQTAEHVW